MKLLEYEAKTLLRKGNVPVPDGVVIAKSADPSSVTLPAVIKSQVPTGGRGKAGGVKIVKNRDELNTTISKIFSLSIGGFTPSVLLAEELLIIEAEHYLSLLIDRDSASIQLIAHTTGGVEVEENKAVSFFKTAISKSTLESAIESLALYLGYSPEQLQPLITKLLDAFVTNDAMFLEINPLIRTAGGEFICGDCKMELDDAAAFRHADWDFEDKPSDANFVILNQSGNVATIANGAGLAMATVDAVASMGMAPANFLDIGGGANTESVLKAFQRIMELESVRAIVINIFAGITRCDEVARAIIAAKQQIHDLPPLFIRLAGTNFEEAVGLLTSENIATLSTLAECLREAKEAIDA